MILVGLGGNLPSVAGDALATCRAALKVLPLMGITVRAVSPWYRSAPHPPSDQPWFVNGVVLVSSKLPAHGLLAELHKVEAQFGRERSVANAARTLDLDLLAYDDEIHADGVVVPHPRLQDRAFVLKPLAALAPAWRHPILKKTATELLALLPQDQGVEALPSQES